MAKYREKPVVIEAVTWYGKYTDGTEWPDWFRNAVGDGTLILLERTDGSLSLRVKTLEGELFANSGDKIIQGVKGEIYPCRPDIFAATYEAA